MGARMVCIVTIHRGGLCADAVTQRFSVLSRGYLRTMLFTGGFLLFMPGLFPPWVLRESLLYTPSVGDELTLVLLSQDRSTY